MEKGRFTESQIVAAIKKQESGIPTKEICRELGISEATFYNWKAKYGGMKISDIINQTQDNYLEDNPDEIIGNSFTEWSYCISHRVNGIIACGWFQNDDILIISADGIFVFDIFEKKIVYEDYDTPFHRYISSDNLIFYFEKRQEHSPIFGLRGGNGNLLTSNNVWKLDINYLTCYKKIPKLYNYKKNLSCFLLLQAPSYEDKIFVGFSKSEKFFLIMGNNGLDIYKYNVVNSNS